MSDDNFRMAGHAQAAIDMVFQETGHVLDFSEPTIGAVEALLNKFSDEPDKSSDLFSKIAILFGSYLGELIRTRYPVANWVGEVLTLDVPPPVVRLGDIDVSPIVWCFKRLHNGPKDNVFNKYLTFREAAVASGYSIRSSGLPDSV